MKPTILALVLLTAAACGDNFAPAPSQGGGPSGPGGGPGLSTAVIVAGDYNVTGVISAMRVPSGVMYDNIAAGIARGDPFLRKIGNEVFVINRASGDNITILDGTLALAQQLSTGKGVNPQDVAQLGRRLYVPGLDTKGVVILDRDHPDARGLVDLSALDPDGKPDCVSAAIVNGRLFVACELLDEHYQARGKGVIAIVDPATNKMTGSFHIAAKNPVGYLVQVPALGDDLVIGTAPSYSDYSQGCLARVKTSGAPADQDDCVVSNKALGGLANHYEVSPDGKALWINVTAYDANFDESGRVVAFDLGAMTLAPKAMTPASMLAVDVAACPNGYAVVIDHTKDKMGARVFAPDGTETTLGAVDIGAPTGTGNNVICF